MKLTMQLKERSYDIILKQGCLKNLYQFANLKHRRVFVVTDSGVPPQYAQTVCAQCEQGTVYTVPAGEGSKCLKVFGQVLQAMLDFGMTRRDLVVAVGGGVVGDLAGFCAATFMRGVDFINCPTTTLAQIDSSIGGKTAVDLGDTKNSIGAFWQPKVVLIDPDVLATLPRRQYANGLAEAIKAGLIADPALFALFECPHPEENIEQIIYRSLLVKKSIVEQDERETGARAALNFGHTIGHGVEAVKGVKGRRKNGLYHGECVALGMLPMIEDKPLIKRTRAIYRALGLPARTGYNAQKVLEYMQHDKKSTGATITVIKVPGLGCWRADTLPMAALPTLLGLAGAEDAPQAKQPKQEKPAKQPKTKAEEHE
ncbi:MAG: 3-dehydroquinate synthase [Gemmiger sp.]|nr:3-dehydroquinate synthase [Gemmiger sp.]